ncbi:MAG TPA: GTP-binding protein [Oligoflexia bacterium]|nr:GTP-binding protein [Oligoflexia bacterium]HMP49854.1 GTP-binding protein [Oligoflexia bacterium]
MCTNSDHNLDQNSVNLQPISRDREQLNLVVVGHVDHGKSTIIGRLLADTLSIPEERLSSIKSLCDSQSKRFEYAFLLDSLQDERAQGITIDTARIFFRSALRKYIIIDAPGHIEFLKNMITGASHADAAVLVVDAIEGIQENSRRHAYMLSLLGVRSLIVVINKMDLVGYKQDRYDELVDAFSSFLFSLSLRPDCFIPVSGIEGDNIVLKGNNMPWWDNQTLLDALDYLEKPKKRSDLPFRMYVQDVYKFTASNDSRRIIAGTIESGSIERGSEVIFYPSGKKSNVHTIEDLCRNDVHEKTAGEAVGFTLKEQLFISRGQLACLSSDKPPQTAKRISVNLFWLGSDSLKEGNCYTFRIGTAKVNARVESVIKVLDASSLEWDESSKEVSRNKVAEAVLYLDEPLSFDLSSENFSTSRFVLFSNFRICGGGIIKSALRDVYSEARTAALERSRKWVMSDIKSEERSLRYKQKPALVLISGDESSDRISLAKSLETALFQNGAYVYFLGIGNIIHGLDRDLTRDKGYNQEHLRRLAEVSNILLDAGLILIVTASGIQSAETEHIRTLLSGAEIVKIWIGEDLKDDPDADIFLSVSNDKSEAVSRIIEVLNQREIRS